MEDQLICGALQTLNEEACEDVLEETEDTKPKAPILPLPESDAGERVARLFADYTCIAVEPDDYDSSDESNSISLSS